ncbi:DUF432 domain-containing protein [Candidatus Sumerlaeota bacterium]|nr:DUF432 domain-containing protein [Candidatus Sumerlaeota bacterium]
MKLKPKESLDIGPWSDIALDDNVTQSWQCGDLRLECRRDGDDFWLRHWYEHDPLDNSGKSLPPGSNAVVGKDDAEWKRWRTNAFKALRFSPHFPDRPVVVKPEHAFILPAGAQSQVYVRCPVWICLAAVSPGEKKIVEIATVILSDTWFGDFFHGELCFWISSSARTECEINPNKTHLAICPVKIINETDAELTVEKICLRVRGLSLYQMENQLWSDETTVRLQSSDGSSQITAAGKPPAAAPKAIKICGPRDPSRSNLFVRAVDSMRQITGFD